MAGGAWPIRPASRLQAQLAQGICGTPGVTRADAFALRSSLERRQMIGATVPIPRAPFRRARARGYVRTGKICVLPRSDAEPQAHAFSWPCTAGRGPFARDPCDDLLDRNSDYLGRG